MLPVLYDPISAIMGYAAILARMAVASVKRTEALRRLTIDFSISTMCLWLLISSPSRATILYGRVVVHGGVF